MKCESCNINEATIHLTQVVNGVVKKVHICQECAEKSGLDLNSPISITDILLGLGGTQEQEVDLPFESSCPVCHLRRNDFKKGGRLGCAHCYENFMGEVNSVISAMHHSTQHVGKLPTRAGSAARQQAEVATLRQQLEGAVAQENFEEAARLREELNQYQTHLLYIDNYPPDRKPARVSKEFLYHWGYSGKMQTWKIEIRIFGQVLGSQKTIDRKFLELTIHWRH